MRQINPLFLRGPGEDKEIFVRPDRMDALICIASCVKISLGSTMRQGTLILGLGED